MLPDSNTHLSAAVTKMVFDPVGTLLRPTNFFRMKIKMHTATNTITQSCTINTQSNWPSMVDYHESQQHTHSLCHSYKFMNIGNVTELAQRISTYVQAPLRRGSPFQ